jgi:SOS-response transcriptional repressor LexA
LGLPEERRLLLGRIAHRVREVPTVEAAESLAEDLLKDLPGRERNVLVRALPRLLASEAAPGAAAASAASSGAGAVEPTWKSVPVVRVPPPPGVDPAASAHDALHVDRRMHRPGMYVLVADDPDAYPRVEPGDHLLVDPAATPGDGDWVVWRDGGRARVRQLRRASGPPDAAEVRLESPRPDVPPIAVRTDRLVLAGVVAWVFRPLHGALSSRAAGRAEGRSA